MDTTPVSHRSRRGRIGIGKSISTPLQSSKKENSVLTNISASPCNNIPFVSTPTSKNISAETSGAVERNEKLTRSALRREFLLEDEDDEFIMPCSQLPNPGENGQVFWNYNASPATARARVALEKKMRQVDDDSTEQKKNNIKQNVPSPLIKIPMFSIRKKATVTADEDAYVRELERKKEADAMLNSMKEIFQAELERHKTQLKTETCDEVNSDKVSSSGSSTQRMSDSHLQCSSNGSTPSDEYNCTSIQKSKLSDQFNPNIHSGNNSFLQNTPDANNKSLGFENLASDDDSFLMQATQAIENECIKNIEKPSFHMPLSTKINNSAATQGSSKCGSNATSIKNEHQTSNGIKLLLSLPEIRAEKNGIIYSKSQINNVILPEENLDNRLNLKEEAFDDDDDFDTLLSQMVMPETVQPSKISKCETKTFDTNVPQLNSRNNNLSNSDAVSSSGLKSSSLKGHQDDKQTTENPPATAHVTNTKEHPNSRDTCKNSNSRVGAALPLSAVNWKRFKSAPGASSNSNVQRPSEILKTPKSFGRRSYSTPDTTSAHNQLPGGRDVSVKLTSDNNSNKPQCSRQEIENKRLEAMKKRDIERKRQEAIKKRQLISQKNNSK